MLIVLLALLAPVPGEPTRGFDPGRPFEGGRHRGVDLAAAPGTPVRAACTGPVAFAGRIGEDGIVTLRCGRWRVTHMPLATIEARGFARRGAVIGTVAPSRAHAGLHLGVRRDGDAVRVRRPAAVPGPAVAAARAGAAAATADRPPAARRRAAAAAARRCSAAGVAAGRAVARVGRPGARPRRRRAPRATCSNPVGGAAER